MYKLPSLDWSLVQAFLAVAETGSLSAAARLLGTSQPTLGRQIKQIEQQLGAELFHRQPRGLALTDIGAALVQPASVMRDAVQRIALTAAGRQASLAGTVRITASVSTSALHLPPIIAGIRKLEPQIAIELVPSDDSRNLLYREADIAVRMYRPTQLDLVTQHIGDIELAVLLRNPIWPIVVPRNPALTSCSTISSVLTPTQRLSRAFAQRESLWIVTFSKPVATTISPIGNWCARAAELVLRRRVSGGMIRWSVKSTSVCRCPCCPSG